MKLPVLAAVLAVSIPAVAHATPYENGGAVNEYVGAYTEHIPIVVPPFHGIEPKLSIDYNSAGGAASVLGVGWRLSGLSVIEHAREASTAGGAGWTLDGQLLIPCADQNDIDPSIGQFRSPSCNTGTTTANPLHFSTLSETYLKIEKNDDEFLVWQPDGTRTTYRKANYPAVYNSGKYLIHSVVDTDGNTVSYEWNPSAIGATLNTLRAIKYGGATIRFYYSTFGGLAPGLLSETFAEQSSLSTIDRRLATIDVCIDALGLECEANDSTDPRRARAYKLSYRKSATTGRALLTSVQMFGKNAVLLGTGPDLGRVLSGDAFPAITFTWTDPAPTWDTVTVGAVGGWGSDWIRGMVDINGDGKTDFCRDQAGGPSGNNILCSKSNGWGLTDAWYGAITDAGGDHDGAWVDWNGDAKSDYCRLVCEDDAGGSCETWEHQNYRLRCAISTGTTLLDQQVGADLASTEIGAIGARWFTDWNGDGRTDFCRAFDDVNDNSIEHLKLVCALSTPAGYFDQQVEEFDASVGWSTSATLADVLGEPSSRAMVDWNGDGRSDFCRVVYEGSLRVIRCVLGRTYAFDRAQLGFTYGYDQRVGAIADAGLTNARSWVDVNGDGKTDYCRQTAATGSSTLHCALSTGAGLIDLPGWGNATGHAESRRWGDVNGDGKADLCSGDGTVSRCLTSAGAHGAGSLTSQPIRGFFEKHWMVDWNGDGRVEYCMNSGSAGGTGSVLSCMRVSSTPMTDLVTGVANGIGGATEITYAPSSSWGQFRPAFPIVSRVTQSGGQEGPVSHDYTYSGGAYDAFSRRFLGFGTVKVTDPCLPTETAPYQCPYTETSYRLDWRWPTRPVLVNRYGGYPAQLQQQTLRFYTDSTLRPYRSDLAYESVSVHEGGSSAQRAQSWVRDRFGNILYVFDGDRTILHEFLPPFDVYITNAVSSIVGTVGPAMQRTTEVRYEYDAKGHAITTRRWLDTTNTFLESSTYFDDWGNVIAEIDAAGNETSYTIDGTYHQYVVETILPTDRITYTALADWDVRCGQKKRDNDYNNGTVTAYQYDDLCRRTRTDLPGGGWETVSYGTGYTEVRGPGAAPWAGGDQWERTSFDGLGRITRVVRRGPQDLIAEEYTYNVRGKIATSARPRYTNGPQYLTTYTYDTRDRETNRTLPSSNVGGIYTPGDSMRTRYELLKTTTTDNLGHEETTQYDVRGQRFWTATVVNSAVLGDLTYYTHDGEGNLTQIQQLVDNGNRWATWTTTYDSLGRSIATTDPDAGNRGYGYDSVGNLIDEIDGNGAQTHYTYDALRRRTSKTTNYCPRCRGSRTVAAVTATWTYDEPRAGFYNAGRLTSMTDPSGTATYDHDAAGNLVKGGRTVDGSAPYVFTKRYDLGGRLLGTTYPDGSTVGSTAQAIEYDEAGRVSYIPGFVFAAEYDAEGQLTAYGGINGSQTQFRTDNARGALMAYSTKGLSQDGPRAVLGEYAASNGSYQTFTIAPALAVGQTITVSTCSQSVIGAEGTGDTYLRLMWKGAAQPNAWQVAQSDSVGGTCGVLSTITYTVPAGGEGVYSVRAGCSGSSTCGGTVAAFVESPAPNLALHQPVYMSSEWDPSCGPSASATDGVTEGEWCTANSMAHTQFEDQPYLFIDLGTAQPIDHVNVWNRSDALCDEACVERLSNYDVKLYDPVAYQWVSIGHRDDAAGWPTRIDAGGFTARYVLVQLQGQNVLNTPEVEVFGVPAIPAVLWVDPLFYDVKLARDQDGRISSINSNRLRESWSYGYSPNGLHQLTSATNTRDASLSESYAYDAVGNMTNGPMGPATYGNNHAVQSAGGITFTYDGNGQQIAQSSGVTLGWDGGGHLISTGGVTYTYDGAGYRLKKWFGRTETIYLADDYEITNGVHTKYVHLGGRLVAMQEGSASPTWLYTDHQGSVVLGLDRNCVQVLAASYGPYGETITGNDGGPGYTGQRKDEAGLLYLHARFANPALGRFLSPDPTIPSTRPIGMNRYAYAQNDPINRSDIDGLGWWEDAGAHVGNASGHMVEDLRKINLGDGMDATSDLLREISGGVIQLGVPSRQFGGHGFGIGNSLALLPNSINAASRGDWLAFGKSVGSEVVIAASVVVSIASYGTAAAAAVAASNALLTEFALTAINNGGDLEAAAIGAVKGLIPFSALLSGSARPEHGLVGASPDQVRINGKWRQPRDHSTLKAFGTVAGSVVGAMMGANGTVAVASRDQAIGLTPSAQLSSASGTLFGYGYRAQSR